MSALLPHAKALRAIGNAMAEEAGKASNETAAAVLFATGFAYQQAATELEALARAECSGNREGHEVPAPTPSRRPPRGR